MCTVQSDFLICISIFRLHCSTMYAHCGPYKKRQHSFVCNFVKNQQILMQFLLLDFKMNDTCDGINLTYLT